MKLRDATAPLVVQLLAALALVVAMRLEVRPTLLKLGLILVSAWGFVIIFATHRRWPFFVGERCRDRWYAAFSLNRVVITDVVGIKGLRVLNYFWGGLVIVLALSTLWILS